MSFILKMLFFKVLRFKKGNKKEKKKRRIKLWAAPPGPTGK